MAKYASCSRAHRSQKGMPRISTTAWRGQGLSVLLPTWHTPSFFVASVFSKSCTTTVRALGAGNAGAARSTNLNDAANRHPLITPSPFPLIAGRLLLVLQIITHYCYYNYFILPSTRPALRGSGQADRARGLRFQKNTSLPGSSVNKDNLQSLVG